MHCCGRGLGTQLIQDGDTHACFEETRLKFIIEQRERNIYSNIIILGYFASLSPMIWQVLARFITCFQRRNTGVSATFWLSVVGMFTCDNFWQSEGIQSRIPKILFICYLNIAIRVTNSFTYALDIFQRNRLRLFTPLHCACAQDSFY